MSRKEPVFVVVVVSALVLTTISGSVQSFAVTDCPGSKTSEAKVLSFKIDSCPDQTARRCTLHIGKNVTLSGELEPTSAFEQANIKISARLGSQMIPIYFSGPMDACGNYGLTCPAVVGQKQSFKFSKKLNKFILPIKAMAQLELTDQKGGRILCKQIPVKLKWA